VIQRHFERMIGEDRSRLPEGDHNEHATHSRGRIAA
jgi:hypothetical protein